MTDEQRTALRNALLLAIREVGIDVFKRTSLFLSNQRKPA